MADPTEIREYYAAVKRTQQGMISDAEEIAAAATRLAKYVREGRLLPEARSYAGEANQIGYLATSLSHTAGAWEALTSLHLAADPSTEAD